MAASDSVRPGSTAPVSRRRTPRFFAYCILDLAAALALASTPVFAQRTLVISPPGGDALQPRISADGRWVFYRGPAGLYMVRPDGSGLREMGVTPGEGLSV